MSWRLGVDRPARHNLGQEKPPGLRVWHRKGFPVKRSQQSHQERRGTARSATYAGIEVTRALLGDGLSARRARLMADDMLSLAQAAALAGKSRTALTARIHRGRCIGLANEGRGFRLPKWQFEAGFLPCVERLSSALGTSGGWALLAFLESPRGALGGATPRQAIEQGHLDRVLEIAACGE